MPNRISQRSVLREHLLTGSFYTLWDLEKLTGFYTGSIASRIRDLRCKGYNIERKATGKAGIHAYRLVKADYVQPELFENRA